jgi:hypothetical protein
MGIPMDPRDDHMKPIEDPDRVHDSDPEPNIEFEYNKPEYPEDYDKENLTKIEEEVSHWKNRTMFDLEIGHGNILTPEADPLKATGNLIQEKFNKAQESRTEGNSLINTGNLKDEK